MSIVAKEIKWDIDFDDISALLDSLSYDKAAETLEISKELYANMTTEERHDYAYDCFKKDPAFFNDILNLPSKVKIPRGLTDQEDISDWLSDTYGYCHSGFSLENTSKRDHESKRRRQAKTANSASHQQR